MAIINGPTMVGPEGTNTQQGTIQQSGTPTYKLNPTIMLYDSTNGELVASWSVNSNFKGHTEKYEYKWQYTTGEVANVWKGDPSSTTDCRCFYTPPSSAKKVRFIVRPIQKEGSNKYKSEWSDDKYYIIPVDNPLEGEGPKPIVSIDGLQLTAEVSIDYEASLANFQVQRNNTGTFHDTNIGSGNIDIRSRKAIFTMTVWAGSEYRVRCRVGKDLTSDGSGWGEWSEWSDNVPTVPETPSGITKCESRTLTSVYLEWASAGLADSYTLEYTTKKSYFDGSNEISSVSTKTTAYELTGLESGKEYFFRVKAVNNQGESGWTEIKSVIIGKGPIAPTTWSSTTTAMLGEMVTLYWVHNAEDGSDQSYANVELDINGVVTVETISGTTSKYILDTSKYSEGAKIKWRVQTSGISNLIGEWSIQRTIDVYAPPVLEMTVTDSSGSPLTSLTTLPINISVSAGPKTQTPISYRISVVANDSYETKDDMGIPMTVNSGQSIYSEYVNPSAGNSHLLTRSLSAAELTLESGITYSLVCSVTMDSGLTAESQHIFVVQLDSLGYYPNARVNIDNTEFAAMIQPFCEKHVTVYYKVSRSGSTYIKTSDEIKEVNGTLIRNASTTTGENVYQATVDGKTIYYCVSLNYEEVSDVLLSVYRREQDGSFVCIANELDASKNIGVTDPHPALDYARYRIVAKTKSTSEIVYYDIPAIYIGGKAILIQWNDERSNIELPDSETLELGPSWNGLGLLLPYNIDISDKYDQDVEFAKYIGRENPVSYYGTQVGHTSTWNTDIPKDDVATIYGLRMLAKWMGDVYVREPSGSGYWANVKVSFGKKHREVAIPVTIEVTRVEGGS